MVWLRGCTDGGEKHQWVNDDFSSADPDRIVTLEGCALVIVGMALSSLSNMSLVRGPWSFEKVLQGLRRRVEAQE